jgi:hypothetical protein
MLGPLQCLDLQPISGNRAEFAATNLLRRRLCAENVLKPAVAMRLRAQGDEEPDTAEFARAQACQVAGENTPQGRGRRERFLRYDGSNYDAGFLPASFCIVGSRGPPFSATHLNSTRHNCWSSNTR